MKEFEKQFPDSNTFGDREVQFGRKEGWKAALEWVLGLPVNCDFSLDEDAIKEELDG